MDVTKVIVTLIGLAVVFGAFQQILANPSGANTVVAAGVDVVAGVTHGLEGKTS